MSGSLFSSKINDRLRIVLTRRESTTTQWFCLYTGPGSSDPHWFNRQEIRDLRNALGEALAIDESRNAPCSHCGRVGSKPDQERP